MPALAQQADGSGTPVAPTPRQIAGACQVDLVARCDTRAGDAAGRACLRQYWSNLTLGCRTVLRRQAAAASAP
ncbi:hypothetical protein [Acidisphaera sp. L21]|uniref:hypothetical protein n=1 Tax=Acidisphaera sp. L21 TaxID=1641851 RepID=UPI00131E75F5|nr:hypothetical protein [Acidisphaera sp. L21]